MKLFPLTKKTLHTKIRRAQDFLAIEISNEHPSTLYISILDILFSKHQNVLISQYFDKKQCNIIDEERYLNNLKEQHNIKGFITPTFIEEDINDHLREEFVINLLGNPSSQLFSEVLRFGMTSLSNIIYPVNLASENWSTDLMLQNKLVVDWFRLVITNKNQNLLRLISVNEVIAITIDSNLFICFDKILYIDKIFSHLESLCDQKGLKLNISSSPI